MSRSTVPYGSWASPISSSLLTAAGIGFSEVKFSAGAVYWLESRPLEAGRVAVVRSSPEGKATDAIPEGFNARTRAHEYGGGAYFLHNETVFFSNFRDQRVYRQDPGLNPHPITPEPPSPASLRYADGRVTPNGKTIICVRERHEEDREAINEIVAIPSDGSHEPRIIISGHDFYSFPRIRPDGGRLAWTCWNHPQMPWDGTELWVADLDSEGSVSAETRVAGGAAESIFQPEWTADGSLYFISDRTGWWNLYVEKSGQVDPAFVIEAEVGMPQWLFGLSRYAFLSNGRVVCVYSRNGLDYLAIVETRNSGTETELTASPPQSRRASRVNSVSVPEFLVPTPYTSFGSIATDGENTVFFSVASASRAPEMAALDLRDNRIRTLRRSLEVRIDTGYLSEPEPVEFPTSNNVTAFALFYPPTNKDFAAPAGERPPLLVFSHGGPTSATNSSLRLAVQFWTSRGFAVVDVNYGGSTGYGRAYRERLKGQWGVVDVEDCINAARYLEHRGSVDGKRLAIRGGSAGGYTTLCALVFHDVFAAGASYYGVADLEALAKDTHKFESRYEEGLVGPYPEAMELYRQRSPVHYADRLSCPVILLQGLEDKVVPPSQAEIMIAALRKKRLPFAYITFPTEGHGFRTAANIERSVESEFYFYSRVFGFKPADRLTPVDIENL